MDVEKIKLMAINEGLREALKRIKAEAADESRDGDANKLGAQMEFIRATAADALDVWR